VEYRKLGRTDITVSVLALGCWAFAGGGNWGEQDDAASIATVRAALDAGVNFFDTAEGYGAGRSEAVLGKALEGRRHEAVIATKVSRANLSPPDLERACERSLRHLNTDYIDLYQIHWPSRTVPLEQSIEALEKLRQQGKVRAIGVCNFGVQDLSQLWAIGHAETNQLPYSLIWRAIEYEVLPECVKGDMGVLCYSPLAQGMLTGKFASADDVPAGRARTRHFTGRRPGARHGEEGCEEDTFAAIHQIRRISDTINMSMANLSLAWVLHQPGVAAVLAGARKPEQLMENLQAVALELSPEIVRELARVTDQLKLRLGANPDPYLGSAESRFR